MTTPTPTTAAPDPVPLVFSYRNWRGEISERHAIPIRVWFGTTEWHPEPQWFLNANDLDKGETRDFALRDIDARAMQEAMSAQGGGEVRPVLYADAQCLDAIMRGEEREMMVCFKDGRPGMIPLYARPAPEVKDAAEAVRRALSDPKAKISLYAEWLKEREPPTPAPAASDELVEALHVIRAFPVQGDMDGGKITARGHSALEHAANVLDARIEADAAEMERKDARIAKIERLLQAAVSACDYPGREGWVSEARAALRPEAKGGRDEAL